MKIHLLIALLIAICLPNLAFSVTPDISAGGNHVLALEENGEVWVWGANNEEQLGLPSGEANAGKPIKVSLPLGRTSTQVAGGDRHSLILLDNGTILSFGRNEEGQLGRTGKNEKSPSVISGLTDVTAIAAGGSHSIALKQDGSVWTFGSNKYGQLGNPQSNGSVPVQVPGLSNIIAIAASMENSYALTKDHTVFEWGYFGGLSGKKADQTSPVQIENLTGITAIAAGSYHVSASKNDGTVWSWGYALQGQLGNNNSKKEFQPPAAAQGITDAIKVAAGNYHTVVLRSDGSMWTFGSNTYGQLGIEEAWATSTIAVPQASVLTKDVVAVTAGIDSTFALKRDGTISAFGYARFSQMGDGHTMIISSPVQIYEETRANKVSCGATHSALLRTDGSVGWLGFYNTKTRVIGQRSPDEQSYQLKVLSTLGNITQIASGDEHTLVLKSDGTVWAYGVGDKGQLGDGKITSSMIPVQVSGITNAVAIAAGGSSSLAVKDDGSVLTWGANSSGQLGDGTTINKAFPVTIIGLTEITAAAMGKDHVIARKADGTVWIWGNNEKAQILENAASTISTPKQIPNLANVEAVAAGEGFCLALLADKTVSAWGANNVGQLGVGDTELKITPTRMSGLSDVVQIAAGSNHAIARLQNGTLKAWGANNNGQLGDGTLNHQHTPVDVKNLTGIRDIAAGESHSIAVRNDATAWSWGSNEKEQSGVSLTKQHRVAIRLITDSTDTDSDGMPDELERTYFGDLSHIGIDDSDGDGWTDIREILLGTDPTLADTDKDNLTDIADAYSVFDLNRNKWSVDSNSHPNNDESSQNKAPSSLPTTNRNVKELTILSKSNTQPTRDKTDIPNDSNNKHSGESTPFKIIIFPEDGAVL